MNQINYLKKGKNAKPKKELDNMLPGSESEKNDLKHIREEDGIDSLAWMAIIGDILHNVTDGLSMGAAFTFSLSAGFASSIAIFCHELPHELGKTVQRILNNRYYKLISDTNTN